MIKKYKIELINILIVLSILTCFSSAPYLGHYLFGNVYTLFSGILSILIFAISYYCCGKYLDMWMKTILFFMFSFIVYGCLMMVNIGDVSDFRKAIGISIKCLYLIGSCYLMNKCYLKFTNCFLKINYWITIGSIILFFIVLLGILWDPIIFIKQDGRPHYLYFPLGATNSRFIFGDITFLRVAGYADEPGAFALILTYLIVLNEFTVKSKKIRIVYLVGACLTFSMAFFITIIPIVLYWIKSRVLKFKLKGIIIFLTLFSVILCIPQDNPIYSGVDALIFRRFRKNDLGDYNGDNRGYAVPIQIAGFKSSPFLGVGSSKQNVEKYEFGAPTFYSYLAMHGLYGTVLFYIPFLVVFFLNIHRKELLLLIAIALNYLQRPSIEEMFSLICLSLIFYASRNEKSLNNSNNGII